MPTLGPTIATAYTATHIETNAATDWPAVAPAVFSTLWPTNEASVGPAVETAHFAAHKPAVLPTYEAAQ